MGKVLIEIEKLQDEVLKNKNHRLVGSPSIHASTIQGGRELSTYPDLCKLQVERRMIPGENQRDIDAEIKSILSGISATDPQFEGKHSITLIRGPMEVSPEEEICRLLHGCTLDVTGKEPEFIGISGWMDTEIIWRKGTPAVAFGPRGSGSHSAVEFVELDSVIDAAEILEMVAMKFCGTNI
jgi:acetylornithine deacetylase